MSAPAPRWAAYAGALIDREVVRTALEGAAHADGTDPLTAADEALAAADAALTAMLLGDGDPAGDPDAGPEPFTIAATMAELDPVAARILAVCAAVELDRTLQRLIAALRADPGATRLDIALAIRLLGTDVLRALGPHGPLARAELVEVEPGAALAAATITVPRGVLWALTGDEGPDLALPRAAELIDVDLPLAAGPDLILVTGGDRVRRVQTAAAGLGGFGFVLTPPPDDDEQWRAVIRSATLRGAAVILDCPGPPDTTLRHWIERADHLRFAVVTREPIAMDAVPRRPFGELAAPEVGATPAEWSATFPDEPTPARMPTAQQLQWAARARRPGQSAADILHRVSSGSLLKHARRVTPTATWDDLVLPPEATHQLRRLVDRYRDRATVHEAWGLPLYPSPGVVAMFSGPSGTGKTTAAEVIAGSLGVEMFRVDLSALVSKYIGETEKNLEEIFDAATAGDYVLLFDEADALFGARSKVSDARDRYANMEVSYLLQRLESFDGFVILTSNFQGNIDDAFLRRIHVAVPFAVPTEADRLLIWQRSLADAPRQDLDLAAVAKRFDLTGGSIRMAALSAAYLAASRGCPIGMTELTDAVTAELTKLRRRTPPVPTMG